MQLHVCHIWKRLDKFWMSDVIYYFVVEKMARFIWMVTLILVIGFSFAFPAAIPQEDGLGVCSMCFADVLEMLGENDQFVIECKNAYSFTSQSTCLAIVKL